MIQMYFGKACKEYREEMNISQEKFALSIGMDRTYYSSVEAGKRNVSIQNIKKIADGCKKKITDDGSIWINIKNRVDDGVIIPPFWIMDFFEDMYLKNIIIWNFDWGGSTNKRFAPRYEYVFWFVKDKKNYTFNLDDIKVPALNYRPDRYKSQLKNPTDVWRISMVSGNFEERTEHPAQYPEKLIERIILAGTNENDIVLDPFMGSGTTAVVAKKLNRQYLGYETMQEYCEMAQTRLNKVGDNND